MASISKREQLDLEIAGLKRKREQDFEDLKNHFRFVQESYNPLNIIKNSIKDVAANTTVSGIIGNVAGFAGDYITDKILPGNSAIKRIGGNVLKFLGRKFLPSKS